MDRLWYGGDYNPEQWPREVWDEDIRLMQQAGVTVVTVGVFSWAFLEPEDGRFDFEWLDDVLDRLHAAGIRVDLATATASPPPWLTIAHPDILPVTSDGVRLSQGSRQQYSPNSKTYRRYADRLVRKLAERYGAHPAVVAWHVNNELGCHVRSDYSDESAEAFRTWLIDKYETIERLNSAWGTAFWSQRYGRFEEILPPRAMPTFPNPTQQLDFDRFSSDAWLGVLRAEASILREVSPSIPITTNFMGFFVGADYWAWAKEVDFLSDDHYADPADPAAPAFAAMARDLMRSLGGGAPWVLMEQATSAVNWRARNSPLPPGAHRSLSLQAVARGADGVMQFQWRQSKAGAEKFHSAMLPHSGVETRIFRETVELGVTLGDIGSIVGERQQARVAILFDWDSWWAHTQEATPTRIDYVATVFRWYRALWERGVFVDFAKASHDLSSYSFVFAPATVVLSDSDRENLAKFVESGGHLVGTYMTGTLDENLHFADCFLGDLEGVFGLRVEEFAPPAEPSMTGGVVPDLRIAGLASGLAREWGEVVTVSTAEVRSTFVDRWLDGLPAITVNLFGAGVAWYVATLPHDVGAVVEEVFRGTNTLRSVPRGIEVVERGMYRFVFNHETEVLEHEGAMLAPGECKVTALT